MKRLLLALLIIPALVHAAPKPTTAQHIQRIEHGFAPIPMGKGEEPRQLDLTGMMKLFHVPGLSVAVFDQGKILWARGYGVTEAGSNHPVTTHTLFQAGSISKPVTAAATLALVEQGKLALDEDVNLKLRTWKLPENEFTRDQKVTLRRILSHTAGLTVHGFPGYASADAATHTTAEPIPTVVQVLDGAKPANTKPVRVEMVPGTKFQYSGGGVTVEQLLVTEAEGKLFPQIMRERVLDKIGMADSTFEQPLPPARMAMAASGTQSDGSVLPGKRHIYPEMAAAGLWTTASDLAKFAIETANSANGKSNRILSQKMTQEMLKSQTNDPESPVGLGFFTSKKSSAVRPRRRRRRLPGHPDGLSRHRARSGHHGQLRQWHPVGRVPRRSHQQ